MKTDKKLWRNRKARKNWRGGCNRRIQVWRWSIHTPQGSMWATAPTMWRCDRTVMRNRYADSSASPPIYID